MARHPKKKVYKVGGRITQKSFQASTRQVEIREASSDKARRVEGVTEENLQPNTKAKP